MTVGFIGDTPIKRGTLHPLLGEEEITSNKM
jgi:hypothetical protein